MNTFAYNLRTDEHWELFLLTVDPALPVAKSLERYIRVWQRRVISDEAQNAHLTKLIPMDSRKVPGLFLADISLAATMPSQDQLFGYRRGMFMFNIGCPCHADATFSRGHEACSALPHPIRLTKAERGKRAVMQYEQGMIDRKFTDIDYLINTGRLGDAALTLSAVAVRLRGAYREKKEAESTI